MKTDNAILEKTFELALEVVKICYELQDKKKEYIMSKQLLRSGTSVGAMVREAQHAESKADFIHKLSIGLKESNESEYWVELLTRSGLFEGIDITRLNQLLKESARMLITIVKTSKANIQAQ